MMTVAFLNIGFTGDIGMIDILSYLSLRTDIENNVGSKSPLLSFPLSLSET